MGKKGKGWEHKESGDLALLFVHQLERERERESRLGDRGPAGRMGAEEGAERESQAGVMPCVEPEAGLNLTTLRSRPEPKSRV